MGKATAVALALHDLAAMRAPECDVDEYGDRLVRVVYVIIRVLPRNQWD